jgi:DNA-binding ferritin-like protein (Dps family)
MMTTFIEKIVGDLGDKRRWRECKARVKALPSAIERAEAEDGETRS